MLLQTELFRTCFPEPKDFLESKEVRKAFDFFYKTYNKHISLDEWLAVLLLVSYTEIENKHKTNNVPYDVLFASLMNKCLTSFS